MTRTILTRCVICTRPYPKSQVRWSGLCRNCWLAEGGVPYRRSIHARDQGTLPALQPDRLAAIAVYRARAAARLPFFPDRRQRRAAR